MGTNDNRERKLKHHEKPIWQHAFKEAMKHTSVEGAERNAWKAVDVCHRVGVFNEEQTAKPPEKETASDEYGDAWGKLIVALKDYRSFASKEKNFEKVVSDLIDVLCQFDKGELELEDFNSALEEVFDLGSD